MYDKHDRQVRLLGKEVQKKIMGLSLSMIDHSKTYISGEIIKNFTLLGSTKFKINETVLESYEKLVLSKLNNNNLDLEVVDNIDMRYDIKIAIDFEDEEIEDVIFVCSKCYSYTTGHRKNECNKKNECIKKNEYNKKKCNVEFDCLLGAFIVQELIKKTAGRNYLREYTIEGL